MDRQVFYAISNRTSEIKKSFDDSHHKLYRFVGLDLPEGLENSNSTIIETSSSDEEHDYSIMEDCRGNQSIRWDFNHENKIIYELRRSKIIVILVDLFGIFSIYQIVY